MTAQGLSARIAAHVTGARFTDLSPAALAATIRSLVDATGVMLAASTLGEGCAAFAELAIESGGRPEASLIGRRARAPLLPTVLANGALAHAIDFEDALDGAPIHPNAAQIPAALALAQAQGGVSGEEFLTAIAVGCDLVCRMGMALTTSPDSFGFYPPPLLGAYGAVAACARIAGLDARQTVDAFSLLLCSHNCSAELKYSPDSTVRAVRDGFAAHAAVQAVLLAKRGVRGFDAPLEGKAGFFALFARGGYDADGLLDRLGSFYWGERLSFKLWPSCRGTHAFVEAVISLMSDNKIAAADIAAIDLSGAPLLDMLAEPRAQKIKPRTAIDAKFSLPFTVAHAALHGTVTLASFEHARLEEAAVLALAQRIHFTADPQEKDMTAGTLTLRLADGTSVSRHVANPRGHPANPMDDATLDAKFLGCAALALEPGADNAALLAAIRGIATLPDMRQLPL